MTTNDPKATAAAPQPPVGPRVVEFTHRVMGPACGMVLADTGADVVGENLKPGTMARYGLDHASLGRVDPRLIYVSHKGFLPAPYEGARRTCRMRRLAGRCRVVFHRTRTPH